MPRSGLRSAVTRAIGAIGALGLVGALAGCSLGRGDNNGVTLEVFAAASLTDALWEIGGAYRASHPEVTLRFNFASSSSLAAQVNEGAPADVFVPADAEILDLLTAGVLGEPKDVATNVLQIIVEAGNPKGISSLSDLARTDLDVVLAAPEVPAGKYAQEVLERAGVRVSPRSLESNVKGVVTKVVLGEADAGIVYATDVQVVGDRADGVVIPDVSNVVAAYRAAVPRGADHPDEAQAFVAFLASPEARAILTKYGFRT